MSTLLKIQHPSEYSGKQVIIKSDRLVFHASTDDILLASKNIIALASGYELHLNSAGNIYLNSKDGKVIIGKPSDPDRKGEQNAVLGNNLLKFLEDLSLILSTFQVETPSGEGTATIKVTQNIQKLKETYFNPSSKSYLLSDIMSIANNKV